MRSGVFASNPRSHLPHNLITTFVLITLSGLISLRSTVYPHHLHQNDHHRQSLQPTTPPRHPCPVPHSFSSVAKIYLQHRTNGAYHTRPSRRLLFGRTGCRLGRSTHQHCQRHPSRTPHVWNTPTIPYQLPSRTNRNLQHLISAI